jgi:hypothetical protein
MPPAGGLRASYSEMPGPAAGPVPPARRAGLTASRGNKDMTVKCSNSACGKTFAFTPGGGTTTRSYSDKSQDKKSYPATCPHCKRITVVTKE